MINERRAVVQGGSGACMIGPDRPNMFANDRPYN